MAVLVVAWVLFLPLLSQPRVAEPPGAVMPSPEGVYDPVAEGEPTPPGFRQLLGRDGIKPIYHPVHADADAIDWSDDTLVIGVAVGGEAVAYPVQTLNRREIVNDRVGGTPILATW